MENLHWKGVTLPFIPIYFIDIVELEAMLDKNPNALNPSQKQACLSYFEEYEKYEKAAVIKKSMTHDLIFGEMDDFITPEDLDETDNIRNDKKSDSGDKNFGQDFFDKL